METILYIWLKVPARKTQLRKSNVFKKGWNFASCSCFATCIMKKGIFIMGERNCIFFPLIFTMELSSTALSYLNAHSTLDFARTSLYV